MQRPMIARSELASEGVAREAFGLVRDGELVDAKGRRDAPWTHARRRRCMPRLPRRHRRIYDLRFNFPHHEPLLRDYVQWVTDPNLNGRQRCDRTAKQWLPKLRTMDPPDRAIAAEQLAKLVDSPKLKPRLDEVVAELIAP
jgi:hypothetical protein